eukprot:GEMP01082459.1.p1 GENE.GEMP01082459.1~~GEMP01082459.1.p1  ORF type:complete len:280 (+),score=16.36 GEMP01082459.1:68-841(+)
MDIPSEEPGRLLVSCDGTPVLDTMTIFGLLAAPQFAKYPYVDLWDYQMQVLVRAPGGIFHIPSVIQEFIGPRGSSPTDVFFTAQACPSQLVNFMPHLWVFPFLEPGAKLGYDDNYEVGLFAFEGSNASPLDVNWNTVGWHQIHIHPQKGGMCLSPNNGRVSVSADRVACIWSVTRVGERTCVGLHWLIPPKIPFEPTSTLRGLMQCDYGAASEALHLFVTGDDILGRLTTPPILSKRQQGGKQGGKKGGKQGGQQSR